MNKNKSTAETILDTAQAIVQEFGFNGFSYAHIAQKVGIRTASIHYYYPNKEDLGEALISRYYRDQVNALSQIDREIPNELDKLRKFTEIFAGPVESYCTCLSVMLSSEVASLSGKVREKLTQFFDANLQWLARVLDQGRQEGHLKFEGSPEAQAHQFFASLQGAQLLARSFRDVNRFHLITEKLISALS